MPPKPAARPASGVGQPVAGTLDYRQLGAVLRREVDAALDATSDEYRKKVIEALPDVFEAMTVMARGFRLQATKADKEGNEYTVVFLVAPHWPAIKYLGDWVRSLLGQGEAKTTYHDLPDDTKELMKRFIEAQEREKRPDTIPIGPDGIVDLGHPGGS